ncbi:LOW QUALITY PROTEIN: sphingosine 1-phosphate receptor 4 [Ctenodactylus gundi]
MPSALHKLQIQPASLAVGVPLPASASPTPRGYLEHNRKFQITGNQDQARLQGLHPAPGALSLPQGEVMNATGSLPPLPPPPPPLSVSPESCHQLAAGGHSHLIVLHYNHSGRLAGRGGPEDGSLGALRGLSVGAGCVVVLENLLVLAAIVAYMRSRRWVYYCLVNTTLSDLLTGAAYLANVLLSGGRTFLLAPAQWFLREGLLFMALAASTFGLLLTAAERFATMVQPWAAESRGTRRGRVCSLIGLCWLAAALLGLLPLLGWNCACAFERCSSLLPLYSKGYVLFCMVVFACILAAILALYGAIFRVVRRSAPRSPRPKSRRLLTTVLLMLAAFVVCWGPLFGLLLADTFGSNLWAQEYLRGMDWILALAVCNSALNPLIYSLGSREVRRAVLVLLCTGCLRLGLRGPGDCVARAAAEAQSAASTTDSSLRPRDSLRGARTLPLSSVSSVRSV